MSRTTYKLIDFPAVHDMQWEARPRLLPPDGDRDCCGKPCAQHYHDGKWFWECFRCGKEVPCE